MTSLRPALAIGASLFVLAGASLLDVARMEPQAASVRGDRQASVDTTPGCARDSLIAACAGTQGNVAAMRPATSIQVFERPGETMLVRVKLGN
ncbi:hypothetical protein [Labrys monachus]|uniref:Uncharacterized protein n=1 Tax=Labrys monachus TaxID=217067 RepID=A0ABU0FE12_9HYPH|nr:hypothetical protein [Labrys monachus]MDQ0392842.1 hypothetical protein [Labrys monachus]